MSKGEDFTVHFHLSYNKKHSIKDKILPITTVLHTLTWKRADKINQIPGACGAFPQSKAGACPCASGNAPQPRIVPLARAGNRCSTQGETLHTFPLKATCWLKASTNTEIYHNTSKQDRTVPGQGSWLYHLPLRISLLSSALLTQQCHTQLRQRCWSRARYRSTFLWFHGWCSTHL